MTYRVGDLARLRLSAVAEGHYYEDGDIVRVIEVWENEDIYRVRILRTDRILHWLPKEADLIDAHPLEQLADVMKEEEE